MERLHSLYVVMLTANEKENIEAHFSDKIMTLFFVFLDVNGTNFFLNIDQFGCFLPIF